MLKNIAQQHNQKHCPCKENNVKCKENVKTHKITADLYDKIQTIKTQTIKMSSNETKKQARNQQKNKQISPQQCYAALNTTSTKVTTMLFVIPVQKQPVNIYQAVEVLLPSIA